MLHWITAVIKKSHILWWKIIVQSNITLLHVALGQINEEEFDDLCHAIATKFAKEDCVSLFILWPKLCALDIYITTNGFYGHMTYCFFCSHPVLSQFHQFTTLHSLKIWRNSFGVILLQTLSWSSLWLIWLLWSLKPRYK